MFDLVLRENVESVPVPVAGRVVMFAGPDGRMWVRDAQGNVFDHRGEKGDQGPAGNAVIAFKKNTSNATASPVVALGPVGLDAYGEGGSVAVDVRGTETNGLLASSLVVQIRVNGSVVSAATMALGTAGQNNRGWRCRGQVRFESGTAYVQQFTEVAGLAPVSSFGSVAYAAGAALNVDVVYLLQSAVLGVSVATQIATMSREYIGALV